MGRSSNPPTRRTGLRATLLAAAACVAVGAGSLADAGTTPRAKLLSARMAVVSSPWRATVEVRGATRRPPVLRVDAGFRAADGGDATSGDEPLDRLADLPDGG